MIGKLKEETYEIWEDLSARICLTQVELEEWQRVKEKIYLPFDPEKRLIEQFEGYFQLKDVVIEEYDENDMPIRPQDMVGVRASQTQINKQADVVMLLYLLGNEFDDEVKKVNYHYYEKRTLQRSSLSPSIHAIMGLQVQDHTRAYRYLRRSALVDLEDNQANVREGIHAASAGGTWKTVVFGFCGMEADEKGILCFNPWFPTHWQKVHYRIYWKQHLLDINITQDNVQVRCVEGIGEEITIKIKGQRVQIENEEKRRYTKKGMIGS